MLESGPRPRRLVRTVKLERIFIILCICCMVSFIVMVTYSHVEVTSGDCSTVIEHNLVLQRVIQSLQARIEVLENELEDNKKLLNDTKFSDIASPEERNKGLSKDDSQVHERKVKDSQNDIRYLLDEYDVIQFASFTQKYIYVVNSGTYGRVLERLEGVKKKDVQEVIMFATSKLYATRKNITERFLFTDGIFRTDPGLGTRYEIYFKSSSDQPSSVNHKISVFRPFGPLHFIRSAKSHAQSDAIHIIMPLSGRTDMLRRFLTNFVQTAIKLNENLMLTIAYSGLKGLNETLALLEKVKSEHSFSNINLIQLRGKFSRGRAIQTAVEKIDQDALMFFCDVDVIFHNAFLQRCRLNTHRGQKVFYPIIFSLYNPEVVYTLQDTRIPQERDQYVISSEAGFWRDFGYGMTCQYRSDFLRLGGFKRDIVGWGMEDVMLFRQYAQSNISVVRSVDHGLFHTWHEKTCDKSLQWAQFKACIRSKARNEASHGLLGMMAFADEVVAYKKRHGMMHHTLKLRG